MTDIKDNEYEDITINFDDYIDDIVLQYSKLFDKLYKEENTEEILLNIRKTQDLLKKDFDEINRMQINYDIANAFHDVREISKKQNEEYLEKEIYYFRSTLDIYELNFEDRDLDEKSKVAQYIAARTYTNLGNTYYSINRYIAAIDCYNNALLINNSFAMASLNLCLVLNEFANIQIENYEKNYFFHASYYFYCKTLENKINLESDEPLEILKKRFSYFDKSYIDEFLEKPLQLPNFKVDNMDEALYRQYLLTFRFFLNSCNDILADKCFAVDSVNLPFSLPYKDKEKELIGLFNQIKQEYNFSRFLWYKVSTIKNKAIYADYETDMIDVDDHSSYTIYESLLKEAFKSAYAIFDRIGFFICKYFNIGLEGKNISFKNVWKNQLTNSKGDIYYNVPNPILRSFQDNPMVKAMYWLQKDFYEKKSVSVTAPFAEPMFKMRNDIEHNCLRIGIKAFNTEYTKYTNEFMLKNNTFRLLKLAREIIIYLSLAVNYEENRN